VTEPAAARSGRTRTLLRVAFAVLSIGGLTAATVAQWPHVTDTIDAVSWAALVTAFLATFAGVFCAILSWRAVLADLGSPLRVRYAVGIVGIGQLGKYLPGSLWPVVAQMELGREHDVPRKRSAVASLLVIVVALTAGGLLAAATLPFAARGSLGPYRPVFLVPAAGLVLLHPRVFNAAAARGLRLLKRAPLEQGLSLRGTAAALGWALAQWACWGLAVWLLGRGLPGAHGPLLAVSLGAYALAWSAGFLFLVAPAGAGVREGALVLLLAPSLGTAQALGVALLVRLLTTVADVGWGAVAFAEGGHRWVRRRAAGRAEGDVTVVTGGTAGQDVRRPRRR
jgi:uncharacterized membrane protein YbhN (UPF0104 family)